MPSTTEPLADTATENGPSRSLIPSTATIRRARLTAPSRSEAAPLEASPMTIISAERPDNRATTRFRSWERVTVT